MTKKHFSVMAQLIREMADRNAAYDVARAFIDLARHDNPRFDVQRFVDACGVLPHVELLTR